MAEIDLPAAGAAIATITSKSVLSSRSKMFSPKRSKTSASVGRTHLPPSLALGSTLQVPSQSQPFHYQLWANRKARMANQLSFIPFFYIKFAQSRIEVENLANGSHFSPLPLARYDGVLPQFVS